MRFLPRIRVMGAWCEMLSTNDMADGVCVSAEWFGRIVSITFARGAS